MPHIVLTAEQAQILREASETVELRDDQGEVLIRILSPAEAVLVAKARRRLARAVPGYSGADIQARFRKLEEISRREELNEEKVNELLRRMRAGETI
jgi:hypothetical protein